MNASAGAKLLSLFVALVLMAPMVAHALRLPSNYACLAKDADNIAIVRVSQAKPVKVYTDYFGYDYYLLDLEVEEQIHLLPEKNKRNKIELLSRRFANGYSHAEDARFKPGTSYLIFLKKNVNGPYVLDGSQGALPFENGKVEIHRIKLSKNQVALFVRNAQKLDIRCEWH